MSYSEDGNCEDGHSATLVIPLHLGSISWAPYLSWRIVLLLTLTFELTKSHDIQETVKCTTWCDCKYKNFTIVVLVLKFNIKLESFAIGLAFFDYYLWHTIAGLSTFFHWKIPWYFQPVAECTGCSIQSRWHRIHFTGCVCVRLSEKKENISNRAQSLYYHK